MDHRSCKTAGILLVVFPAVIYGGASLLWLLISPNSLRIRYGKNLFRAGQAHAGVLLVVHRYVDEAVLAEGWKQFVRSAIPAAAILLPAGFVFLCFLRQR